VPAAVVDHAKVFASVTAPGFGPVHTTPNDKHGRRARCRPRGKKTLCGHGRPTWCMKVHADDDPTLGEPLCAGCYDYRASAAFNWVAPELWRRFTITLPRALARMCRMSARAFERQVCIQYAKVAEFQRRGVVHFHAIIRVDGRPARDDEERWPAPPVHITPAQLAQAVREAAGRVRVHVDTGTGEGLVLRFGEQVDAQSLTRRPDLDAGDLRAEQVAAYVAKYATKAAEDLGLGERRLVPDLHHARRRGLTGHVLRLLEAADQLGDVEAFAGIRKWLHMLGFRGHFATKSRRYSTTMGALREERREFRRHQARQPPQELGQLHDPACDDPDGEDTTLVIARWEFAGVGYLSNGDAALAASAAARARERREAGCEARRDARAARPA
jgi:replication initiator protein RepSA